MALMGGLVETRLQQAVDASKPSHLGEWMTRHAWRLVFASSLVFWLIIALAYFFS